MKPKVGVVVFPGSNCDLDAARAFRALDAEVEMIWHEAPSLGDVDVVILPGGFAHGDHLRTGAIARFSPVMASVEAFAAAGGPVIGSCNGFQVLTEAGLLPGALLRNDSLEFRCEWQWLRVEAPAGPFLGELEPGALIRLPISHGEGRYYADDETLDALEATGRVALRYTDADGRTTDGSNPNGSMRAIAGIVNERGNVLGLMPHPERAAEPELGGDDGLALFRSLVRWLDLQPAGAERRL